MYLFSPLQLQRVHLNITPPPLSIDCVLFFPCIIWIYAAIAVKSAAGVITRRVNWGLVDLVRLPRALSGRLQRTVICSQQGDVFGESVWGKCRITGLNENMSSGSCIFIFHFIISIIMFLFSAGWNIKAARNRQKARNKRSEGNYQAALFLAHSEQRRLQIEKYVCL